MGEPDGVAPILRDVIRPRIAYLAARPTTCPPSSRTTGSTPGRRWCACGSTARRFRPYPAERPAALPADIGDLNRLYGLGFASWLPSPSIANGVYYGVRVGGRLVAAAARTSSARSARLAVVGNVMTHHDFRGRGYAKAVTGAVTAELLRMCDHVVLNVRSDNPPALAAYRRLGYAEHIRFEERLVHRRGVALGPSIVAVIRARSSRAQGAQLTTMTHRHADRLTAAA